MNSVASSIDIGMNRERCVSIEPGSTVLRNEDGLPGSSKERGEEKLLALEELISTRMQKAHTESALATLETPISSMYVDFEQKGGLGGMTYLVKEYAQSMESPELANVLVEELKMSLTMGESGGRLDQVDLETFDIDSFFELYVQELSVLKGGREEKVCEQISNVEASVLFDVWGRLMKAEGEKCIVAYLDGIGFLGILEQKQLNRILYGRGAVGGGYVRLRINNGAKKRKNRFHGDSYIQSPGDYSTVTIREKEMDKYLEALGDPTK